MNKIIFSFLCLLLLGKDTIAAEKDKDIIRIPQAKSQLDRRFDYPERILNMALNASIDKYGPFEVVKTNMKGNRDRMLEELQDGTEINVHSAPTRPEWEEKAIPVMFPVLKGLLGYRIFLIHKDNLEKFRAIKTIDDLKQLTAGLGAQWSTTKSLRAIGGFKIETGTKYELLFRMLQGKRFDYFIRGVNEAFTEYEERKDQYPEMMIEPFIVMELPLPWFFFVSPKHKRIAERIEYGLQKMKADGSFDKEFYAFYGEILDEANLHNRKLFRVKNLQLTPHKIYDDSSYWIDITKITPLKR